ncbi:hypothetical protein Q6247_25895, partial [Klebsiella pneumoniae]
NQNWLVEQMSKTNSWEGSWPLSIAVLSYRQEARNRGAIFSGYDSTQSMHLSAKLKTKVENT